MLETLRQFAAARLGELGEADDWLNRHALFYRDRAEQLELQILSPDEAIARQVLAVEWDNFRAAFDHALATGNADVVAALPAALGSWHVVAALGDSEAGEWARAAIRSGLLDGHPDEIDVRGAWSHWAFVVRGDQTEAWGAIAGQLDRLGEAQRSTFPLAWLLAALGRGDQEALRALTSSWPLLNHESRLSLAAIGRHNVAALFHDPDDDFDALTVSAQTQVAEIGAPNLAAFLSLSLGLRAFWTDPASAVAHFERTVELDETGGHSLWDLHGRNWLATAIAISRPGTEALRPAQSALARAVEHHVATEQLRVLLTAAVVLADAEVNRPEAAAIALGAHQASGYSAPISSDLVTLAEQRIRNALDPIDADRYLNHGRSLDVMEATIETLDALDAAISHIDGQNTPAPDTHPN